MKIKGDEVGGRPSKESAPNNGKLLLLLLPFVILTLNSVLFPPHHPGLEFMWFTVPSCIYISLVESYATCSAAAYPAGFPNWNVYLTCMHL